MRISCFSQSQTKVKDSPFVSLGLERSDRSKSHLLCESSANHLPRPSEAVKMNAWGKVL